MAVKATPAKRPSVRPKKSPPAPTPRPKPVSSIPKSPPTPDRGTISKEATKPPQESNRVGAIVAGLQADKPAAPDAPKTDPNAGALKSLDEVTSKDHKFWGGQTTTPKGKPIKSGHKENEGSHYKTVGEYWKGTAMSGTDGKDRKQPWSAAYISSAHKRAGVTNFPPSIRHSTYINNAVEARKSVDQDAPYWGYRPSERAPKQGDMVCFGRGSSSATFDDQQGGKYPSHCDFVKKVGKGYIETLGGNVGDSVSTRRFTTDEKGLLNDPNQRWIAVLGPRNLKTD
jgi:hypothetical protein